MNYFKQGTFFYGRRPDGKYIQVATFGGLSLPTISVVSQSTAIETMGGPASEQIPAKEFKHTFAQAVIDITMMDYIEMPEVKSDELNESDVQKEN